MNYLGDTDGRTRERGYWQRRVQTTSGNNGVLDRINMRTIGEMEEEIEDFLDRYSLHLPQGYPTS